MAIDDVFATKVAISEERYTKLQVSATADGAALNTGIYNGLLTRMREDGRPWLMSIHCVSHHLGLAVKESLLKHTDFSQVKDTMVTIFYLMKQSGKFQRQFNCTAEALGVQVYTFPKVHGTRFINHQRNGVRALLNNWIPLMMAIENAVANQVNRPQNAKLFGILNKLRDVHFLAAASLLKAILDIVARLSLTFEEGNIFVFDAIPAICKMTGDLEDLLEDDQSPIAAEGKALVGNVLSYSMPKPGHMKRKEENREFVTVRYDRTMHAGEDTRTVNRLKAAALPTLNECADNRFTSLNSPFYQNMHWANPAHWQNDASSELKSIDALAEHFSTTLAVSGYDGSKVKREWKKPEDDSQFLLQGSEGRRVVGENPHLQKGRIYQHLPSSGTDPSHRPQQQHR